VSAWCDGMEERDHEQGGYDGGELRGRMLLDLEGWVQMDILVALQIRIWGACYLLVMGGLFLVVLVIVDC